MKIKTKEFIAMAIIILIIITGTTVKAESTFKASVTANTTELKPEEEVTITVGLSDIDMGTNGINTLEGTIQYDKDIFEKIKSSSIQSLNNWATTYNDESSTINGKFLAVNLSTGIKENTQVFKITLKVKKEIKKTTSTQIDFKDITSNNGTDLINVGTKSVKLTINVESTNTIIPEVPSNNENKNNTNDENKTEINKNTTSTNKAQVSTKLPHTGKAIWIIFALVIAINILIVLGIKNRNMRDIK